MAREHDCLYGLANAEHLRVIVRDGRPISHFGFVVWDVSLLGVAVRVASVGGVGTRPDCRQSGWATLLLNDAEAVMRREAVDLVLVSGCRGLYTRNGYARTGRCLAFELTRPPCRTRKASGLAVRPFQRRDLAALGRLCAGEPVRFRRSGEQLKQLMAGRMARVLPDRFFMVSIASRDVAWFDVSTTLNGRARLLWEYAGDRAAVIEGLSAVMRQERMTQLSVTVPADDALAARLYAAGFTPGPDALPDHTFKILDFGIFMEKLRPVWRERAGAACADALRFASEGPGGTIRDGRQILRLPDSSAAVGFVFGDGAPPAAVRRAGGRIAAFARAALPLPVMLPGMNYV